MQVPFCWKVRELAGRRAPAVAALAGMLLCAAPRAQAQLTSSGEHIQYALVTAKDYAFDAPANIAAGIITFHLVNQGSDVHQLSIVELGAGHTIKEFFDAIRAKGVPPAWTTTVGLTATIPTNAETFLTVRLAPGKYVLSCMIPAKDGRSHVEKGMYQYVNIVAKTPAAKKKP
jgi:hypothetical protein